MRLWSIHPVYLDCKALIALWREGLLAQAVLKGNTKGYKNHPQLIRFKNSPNPLGAIAFYLGAVADEASLRGYNFDRNKIGKEQFEAIIPVNSGQVLYEFQHLLVKLKARDSALYERLKVLKKIKTHPLFREVCGDVETWEIRKN